MFLRFKEQVMGMIRDVVVNHVVCNSASRRLMNHSFNLPMGDRRSGGGSSWMDHLSLIRPPRSTAGV